MTFLHRTRTLPPESPTVCRPNQCAVFSISDFFLVNDKLTSTRALINLLQGATSADPHVQVLISSMLAREAERERTTVAKLAAFLEARPNATNDD